MAGGPADQRPPCWGDDQYYARALRTDDFDDDVFADVEVRVPPGELRRYRGGPAGLSERD